MSGTEEESTGVEQAKTIAKESPSEVEEEDKNFREESRQVERDRQEQTKKISARNTGKQNETGWEHTEKISAKNAGKQNETGLDQTEKISAMNADKQNETELEWIEKGNAKEKYKGKENGSKIMTWWQKVLCLCHYGPAWTFWFQTNLGRKNSASYLKIQTGKTDAFSLFTSAESEEKDSRRSGMYQSLLFLTRLGTQSL